VAKIMYDKWRPQQKTRIMLEKLSAIIEDYKQRGFYPLSLRQETVGRNTLFSIYRNWPAVVATI